MEQETPKPFEGWAILELMGHRRLGGYVSERVIAGQGFIQINVYDNDLSARGTVTLTQMYSPSSLYCLTPCTEETARAVNDRTHYMTVHPLDMVERQREVNDPQAQLGLE